MTVSLAPVNGWVPGLSETVYHSDPAISASDCKLMLSSPAHYKNRPQFEETDAMKFGSAFHKLILEGQPAMQACFEVVEGVRSAKRKEDAAERGVTLLTCDQGQDLMNMQAAIQANEDARRIIDLQGPCEISGFWQDKETGLNCRLRADKLCNDGIIVDLKTFALKSEYNLEESFKKEFSRAIWTRRYDLQAAYYLDGANAIEGTSKFETFAWIVITKEIPHLVGVWVANNETIKMGRQAYRECLSKFRRCFETGAWPLPDIGPIAPIGIPEWAILHQQREDSIYD
jgi:hypothetical protein